MENILSNSLENIDKIITILESLTGQIDDSNLTMKSKQLYAEMLGQIYMDRKEILKEIDGIIEFKYKRTRSKKPV
jgi:hypothetical protein